MKWNWNGFDCFNLSKRKLKVLLCHNFYKPEFSGIAITPVQWASKCQVIFFLNIRWQLRKRHCNTCHRFLGVNYYTRLWDYLFSTSVENSFNCDLSGFSILAIFSFVFLLLNFLMKTLLRTRHFRGEKFEQTDVWRQSGLPRREYFGGRRFQRWIMIKDNDASTPNGLIMLTGSEYILINFHWFWYQKEKRKNFISNLTWWKVADF